MPGLQGYYNGSDKLTSSDSVPKFVTKSHL